MPEFTLELDGVRRSWPAVISRWTNLAVALKLLDKKKHSNESIEARAALYSCNIVT